MRGKMGFLCGVCFMFLGLITAGTAIGADSVVWNGVLGEHFYVSFSGSSDYNLYLTSTNNLDLTTNSILLVTKEATSTPRWSFDVYSDSSNTVDGKKLVRGAGSESIELGSSTNFKFVFSDGTNFIDFYDFSGDSTTGWTGSLAGQSFTVTGAGVKSVSAVPIPGSALLLGSSLLGLVGISTRKKKA